MIETLFGNLAIFILSLLVGVEVISKIPSTLHTPMMSGANAIHGVVIAGAVLTASLANSSTGYVLTFVAALLAAANVFGGFVVTDRMLQMFTRPGTTPSHTSTAHTSTARAGAAGAGASRSGAEDAS